MKKVAISACLLGCNCRYDATHNLNEPLLALLKNYELISFCPEDHAFGSPRPTMDLIETKEGVLAFSNENQNNLSSPIFEYAEAFFTQNPTIDLYIGKERSPSCGVKSAKVYTPQKELLHIKGQGLMSQVALKKGLVCWDAEEYVASHSRD